MMVTVTCISTCVANIMLSNDYINVSKLMNSLYDFTVEKTSSFVSTLSQFDNKANSYFICYFNVTNLYTNISLQETIDIILNYVFFSTNNVVLGLSSKLFSDLLQLAVLNSFFVFNQKLYRQIEGWNGPYQIFLCLITNRSGCSNALNILNPYFTVRRYFCLIF